MNKCELNEEKCSLFRRREWTTESEDIQRERIEKRQEEKRIREEREQMKNKRY